MRSKILTTVAASTQSSVFVADPHLSPFNIGVGVVVTGTVNYDIQHSFDDPQIPASMTWFNHATIAGQTINKDGNYQYPVRAIRINQNSGTGTVTATIIQAGLK